jgi:hypothetical protein
MSQSPAAQAQAAALLAAVRQLFGTTFIGYTVATT